ncbi:MAG: DinB family protein [Planctomycetota bacterium]
MTSYEQRPGNHECFDYHRDYVAMVPDGNILEILKAQQKSIPNYIRSIPAEQLSVVHSPYGWSVRTVIEHCCDAERVFGYRALRFATGDQTDLPGWDETHYASCGYGQELGPEELAEEFASLRASSLGLLRRLKPENLGQIGNADGRKVSVRTIVWLMAGHWIHHHRILEKRLNADS